MEYVVRCRSCRTRTIDVEQARRAGATFHDTEEILADLDRIARKTTTAADLAKIETTKAYVRGDAEVLICGRIDHGSDPASRVCFAFGNADQSGTTRSAKNFSIGYHSVPALIQRWNAKGMKPRRAIEAAMPARVITNTNRLSRESTIRPRV